MSLVQEEAVFLGYCGCSEAKRLAISFSTFFLHNTTHYIRTATFVQNWQKIEGWVLILTMYKEPSHKHNALKIYVQSERTKDQCIGKPHWMHEESMRKKTTLNAQRKQMSFR